MDAEAVLGPIADVAFGGLFFFVFVGFLYGRAARKLPWSTLICGFPIAIAIETIATPLFPNIFAIPIAIASTIAGIELGKVLKGLFVKRRKSSEPSAVFGGGVVSKTPLQLRAAAAAPPTRPVPPVNGQAVPHTPADPLEYTLLQSGSPRAHVATDVREAVERGSAHLAEISATPMPQVSILDRVLVSRGGRIWTASAAVWSVVLALAYLGRDEYAEPANYLFAWLLPIAFGPMLPFIGRVMWSDLGLSQVRRIKGPLWLSLAGATSALVLMILITLNVSSRKAERLREFNAADAAQSAADATEAIADVTEAASDADLAVAAMASDPGAVAVPASAASAGDAAAVAVGVAAGVAAPALATREQEAMASQSIAGTAVRHTFAVYESTGMAGLAAESRNCYGDRTLTTFCIYMDIAAQRFDAFADDLGVARDPYFSDGQVLSRAKLLFARLGPGHLNPMDFLQQSAADVKTSPEWTRLFARRSEGQAPDAPDESYHASSTGDQTGSSHPYLSPGRADNRWVPRSSTADRSVAFSREEEAAATLAVKETLGVLRTKGIDGIKLNIAWCYEQPQIQRDCLRLDAAGSYLSSHAAQFHIQANSFLSYDQMLERGLRSLKDAEFPRLEVTKKELLNRLFDSVAGSKAWDVAMETEDCDLNQSLCIPKQ